MVLAKSKGIKGHRIQIAEDLTKLNSEVLASARKKIPDEIDDAWYHNDNIFIKWKSTGSTEKLLFKNYNTWLDLSWPKWFQQISSTFWLIWTSSKFYAVYRRHTQYTIDKINSYVLHTRYRTYTKDQLTISYVRFVTYTSV